MNTAETKRCPMCCVTKGRGDYFHTKKGKWAPYCKPCSAVRKRKGQLSNAELKARVFPEPGKKRCPRCETVKPRTGFSTAAGKIKVWCRECVGEVRRARYAATKDVQREKRAERKARNPDAYRQYARMGQQRRRARKASLPSTLTNEEWAEIVARYGGRCLCCGTTEGITMDHVVPISKGGGHTADNVQPLCGPCNFSKHAKVIDYRPGRVAA